MSLNARGKPGDPNDPRSLLAAASKNAVAAQLKPVNKPTASTTVSSPSPTPTPTSPTTTRVAPPRTVTAAALTNSGARPAPTGAINRDTFSRTTSPADLENRVQASSVIKQALQTEPSITPTSSAEKQDLAPTDSIQRQPRVRPVRAALTPLSYQEGAKEESKETPPPTASATTSSEMCTRCGGNGTVRCEDCATFYCTSCDMQIHTGKWASHNRPLSTPGADGNRNLPFPRLPPNPPYNPD